MLSAVLLFKIYGLGCCWCLCVHFLFAVRVAIVAQYPCAKLASHCDDCSINRGPHGGLLRAAYCSLSRWLIVELCICCFVPIPFGGDTLALETLRRNYLLVINSTLLQSRPHCFTFMSSWGQSKVWVNWNSFVFCFLFSRPEALIWTFGPEVALSWHIWLKCERQNISEPNQCHIRFPLSS